MPGSIVPLPVMLEEEDRKIYEKLAPPSSMVVRYGYMKLIAELPYDGEGKPGCGSKVVIRTDRGTELADMLTTTCPNAGCGMAVSRKQMLQYIENSGGKSYPFTNRGRVLRLATVDDLREQQHAEQRKPQMIRRAREIARELDLPMKLVEVELLLGGERVIFHYASEQWIDFRELVKVLAAEFQTRIEMHQVNPRDEARIVADYERCGQQCCCKQFLKVLKPVSMRSAKVQKATLDPTKISGRCGRLMCCLRYEDETYESLRKKLPKRQSRVVTADGPGVVLDSQILTQLILVRLDNAEQPAAYPLESIEVLTAEEAAKRGIPAPPGPVQFGGGGGGGGGANSGREGEQGGGARQQRSGPPQAGDGRGRPPGKGQRPEPRRPKPGQPLQEHEVESADAADENAELPLQPPSVAARDRIAGPGAAAGMSNAPGTGDAGYQGSDADASGEDAEDAGQGGEGSGSGNAGAAQGAGGMDRPSRRRRRRGPRRGGGGPAGPFPHSGPKGPSSGQGPGHGNGNGNGNGNGSGGQGPSQGSSGGSPEA